MIARAVRVLLLAASIATLQGVALAGDWEGPYTCAPWYCYSLWGRYWYQHWPPYSSDDVAVFNSAPGVTALALKSASVTAAAQWTSRVYGMPSLTFNGSTDQTRSVVMFVADANWLALGLDPAGGSITFTLTNSDSTVRHSRTWIRVTSLWGWSVDCNAPGANCWSPPYKSDLPTILAHEFGHWWRIGNSPDDDEACASDLMYPHLTPGFVNRTPSSEDIASAQGLYDQPVDVAAALYHSDAEPDRVDLTWLVRDPGQDARLERCSPSSGWSTLEAVSADGTGYVHFTDTAVIPGTRYGYRLHFSGSGGDVLAGETWVDVPFWALALAPIGPNPSSGSNLRVRFVLPDAAPASLEVIDVAGRSALHVDLGARGRGAHTLNLASDAPMATGLYWLRLQQGPRSLTTRLVIVR